MQKVLTLSSWIHRSVPTKDDILVPETLLKKRKSQEKQREENAAERDKKRKVGAEQPFQYIQLAILWRTVLSDDGDDNTILVD